MALKRKLIIIFAALQTKLNEEKNARQKADLNFQEKERQISMLSVDYRQIQQRLQKLEGEYRQEVEKGKALHSQVEQEQQKKTILQSEMAQQANELTKIKAKESQVAADLLQLQVSILCIYSPRIDVANYILITIISHNIIIIVIKDMINSVEPQSFVVSESVLIYNLFRAQRKSWTKN